VSNVNSVNNKTSRYVQGGLTEVGPIGLEIWNRYDFQSDPSDTVYVVEQKFTGRPDLIANAFYGDWSLWWIICQLNRILDPYLEIEQGTILLLPSKERLQLMFVQPIGGVATTRQEETLLPPIVL
jgi:hypothetical protein